MSLPPPTAALDTRPGAKPPLGLSEAADGDAVAVAADTPTSTTIDANTVVRRRSADSAPIGLAKEDILRMNWIFLVAAFRTRDTRGTVTRPVISANRGTRVAERTRRSQDLGGGTAGAVVWQRRKNRFMEPQHRRKRSAIVDRPGLQMHDGGHPASRACDDGP